MLGPQRQRARQRRALTLAAGEHHAALAHQRLVAVREVGHVLRQLRPLRRVDHTIEVERIEAVAHVLRQRQREQEGILGNHGDARAERGQRNAVHVDAVQEDRAIGHLVQPGNQRGQRGLARADRAHDSQRAAGRDVERDVAQGRLPLGAGIEEVEASELDLAPQLRPAAPCRDDRRWRARRRALRRGAAWMRRLAAPARPPSP